MFKSLKNKIRKIKFKIKQHHLPKNDVNVVFKLETLSIDINKIIDGEVAIKDIPEIFKNFNDIKSDELKSNQSKEYYKYLSNVLKTDTRIKKIIRKEKLKQILEK